MPISSTRSSYYTDEAPPISNVSQAPSQEEIVAGVAFDVFCRNKDETSRRSSADQVRFELKRAPDSSSYTIIKVEGKSYRISVHKQKHQFSYTKDDWQKIADKIKDLVSISNPQGNFLKGTLKLQDRTWTPIFSNKTNQPEIEETTLHNIITGIKQLFNEISPLNALPSSKNLDAHPTSPSNSLSDSLSSPSFPDTQTSSFRKRPLEKENLDSVTTKRRKKSFHISKEEDSNLTTTKLPSEEKQETILKKVQGWVHGVKDRVFPQKPLDTLSHLDLGSDTTSLAGEEHHPDSLSELEYRSNTTSSMEGSLDSEDIGGSRTVLKDPHGFNL